MAFVVETTTGELTTSRPPGGDLPLVLYRPILGLHATKSLRRDRHVEKFPRSFRDFCFGFSFPEQGQRSRANAFSKIDRAEQRNDGRLDRGQSGECEGGLGGWKARNFSRHNRRRSDMEIGSGSGSRVAAIPRRAGRERRRCVSAIDWK